MLKIKWWNLLDWEVLISWSKNAALPLIAASLLIKWKITLNNIPKIWDVLTFLEILESIWVKNEFKWSTLILDTVDINNKNIDLDKIKKIRASILLLSPMLYHFWFIKIPFPWWCSIWARPIDSHISWLERIWYKTSFNGDEIDISWIQSEWDISIDAWFWVTSTENLIVANVLRKGNTTIYLSAIEPHVMNLISFLRKVWADISIKYDHTIIIKWVDSLVNNIDFKVAYDYIEAGTFMVIWALASKKYIDIKNACINDLRSFILKLVEAGVRVEELWNDTLRVYRSEKINWVNVQTNIFPWFPTDLQSPFAVLLSLAEWRSKIFEILFEWRLNFLVELEKMWWKNVLLNPNQAIIDGVSRLKWSTVTSWDLRAWAAMIIAWLVAEWETNVTRVEYIERWYENFVDKLKSLWADIELIK